MTKSVDIKQKNLRWDKRKLPTSVVDLLNVLEEISPSALKAFKKESNRLQEYLNPSKSVRDAFIKDNPTASEVLLGAFVWEHSRKGHAYWDRLRGAIKERERQNATT